jgi:hypothetical protein
MWRMRTGDTAVCVRQSFRPCFPPVRWQRYTVGPSLSVDYLLISSGMRFGRGAMLGTGQGV